MCLPASLQHPTACLQPHTASLQPCSPACSFLRAIVGLTCPALRPALLAVSAVLLVVAGDCWGLRGVKAAK